MTFPRIRFTSFPYLIYGYKGLLVLRSNGFETFSLLGSKIAWHSLMTLSTFFVSCSRGSVPSFPAQSPLSSLSFILFSCFFCAFPVRFNKVSLLLSELLDDLPLPLVGCYYCSLGSFLLFCTDWQRGGSALRTSASVSSVRSVHFFQTLNWRRKQFISKILLYAK